jgi:lysophospholipid acyltransferase (LPLAT)-like uncharacterized protein
MKSLKIFFRTKWASKLVALYLKFVYKTSKWSFDNKEVFKKTEHLPRIFCFWHGQLSMMPFAWGRDEKFYMLLSKHGDGQFIANVILNWKNLDIITGSTNRDGMNAIRKIVGHLRQNRPIGITPDGPRGPKHKVSEGTALLAYLSQAVVTPVTFHLSNCFYLKTWDRFCFPLPFSKGRFIFGEPFLAPSSKNDFVTWRSDLEKAMNGLSVEG